MAQILLRSPDDLKVEIQSIAKKMGIPTNALILQILWTWLEENQDSTKP